MKLRIGLLTLVSIGLIAITYSYSSGINDSQLFLSERLKENKVAFLRYMTVFGKSYSTAEEYKFRLTQFENILKIIEEHDEVEMGYSVGLN